jgi:hypothetical protein
VSARSRVAEVQAVHWWIDQQIAKGKTDEQIARELPVAMAFITGRLSLDALTPRARAAS